MPHSIGCQNDKAEIGRIWLWFWILPLEPGNLPPRHFPYIDVELLSLFWWNNSASLRFGGGETSPHVICIPRPVPSPIKDFPVLYSTPAIVDMKVGVHTVCPPNLSSLESRVTEYDPNPCETHTACLYQG